MGNLFYKVQMRDNKMDNMGHLVKNKEIWSTYFFKCWTHCILNHYHLLSFLIDFETKETEESLFYTHTL